MLEVLGPVATATCVVQGHLNVVQCLLDHGADANFQDVNHRTPLSHAAGRATSKLFECCLNTMQMLILRTRTA
jgi:ankyrin repeat protein